MSFVVFPTGAFEATGNFGAIFLGAGFDLIADLTGNGCLLAALLIATFLTTVFGFIGYLLMIFFFGGNGIDALPTFGFLKDNSLYLFSCYSLYLFA